MAHLLKPPRDPVWNVVGGTATYLARNRVRALVSKSPLSRGATFVLCATLLAWLAEAVTTTLTNLAVEKLLEILLASASRRSFTKPATITKYTVEG